jgi:hypothetical protein
MDYWPALLWCLLALAILPALYGLHRVCLWLEARGLLFYWHRKPESSALGCFAAVQKIVEPQAQHVVQVKEEKPRAGADQGDGEGSGTGVPY